MDLNNEPDQLKLDSILPDANKNYNYGHEDYSNYLSVIENFEKQQMNSN